MTYVFGALAAALFVIYMARPNFRRAVLSAALFFRDDPVLGSTSRIAWSTPHPTPLFYLQLSVVLLLLLAVPHCPGAAVMDRSVKTGVRVLVDRSASMSTRQNGATRFDAAGAGVRPRVGRRGRGAARAGGAAAVRDCLLLALGIRFRADHDCRKRGERRRARGSRVPSPAASARYGAVARAARAGGGACPEPRRGAACGAPVHRSFSEGGQRLCDRSDDRRQRHAGAAVDGKSERSRIPGRCLDRRLATGAERWDRRSRGHPRPRQRPGPARAGTRQHRL